MVTLTTPLPAAPQRGDGRDDFSDEADAFAADLVLYQAQQNQQALDLDALALQAAASAASAANAPGTNAAGTTSMTIGLGAQPFVIQTGKAYAVGQSLIISANASPGNDMSGKITAFNSGTGAITVNVTTVSGSGTFADWSVAITASSIAATKAELLAGTSMTKFVSPKALFDAAANVVATFGSTTTINLANGLNQSVTVTSNFTLANFTGLIPGVSGRIRFTIGGAGGYTWTAGNKFDWFPGGVLPDLPSAAGSVFLLQYFVHDANTIEASVVRR